MNDHDQAKLDDALAYGDDDPDAPDGEVAAEEVVLPAAAEAVEQLAALAAMQHGVKVLVDEQRAATTAAAVAVWRKTGAATTFRHGLGTVSLRQHHDQVAVVDNEALLNYVLADEDLSKTEVEVITTIRVRPAYVNALLQDLVIAKTDAGEVILDKTTGEEVSIPGVSIVRGGDPDSISVSLSADTKATAEAMARARLAQLVQFTVPAIERGGGEH